MKKKGLKNRGFTLAELTIAMIISVLVLILIVNTFILNQKTFRKSTRQAELIQNARIAIDVMARDIRQADEIVTALPIDDSDPELLAHELEFEDGHEDSRLQYIRYYLADATLKRQIIVYYFESEPDIYVRWNDLDAFGPPEQLILDEKETAENISALNVYGNGTINIEMSLQLSDEEIDINAAINPRNT